MLNLTVAQKSSYVFFNLKQTALELKTTYTYFVLLIRYPIMVYVNARWKDVKGF